MSYDKPIKISACLVVYNEGTVIERCLKSLVGVVDEIIVIHDGPCQDETLKIAKSYGARTMVVPHVGVAEPIRPLTFELARGEWILQIDADEFLSPELRKAIPEIILEKEVEAFEFLWPLYDGKKQVTKYWPYKRCLFRRSAISFLGLPNYISEISGKVAKIPLILQHRPSYNNYSWSIFINKWVPWARIQGDLYLKDFSELSRFNYVSNKWPRNIVLRRRYPLLIMVPDFFIVIIKNLLSGAYKEGLVAWRAALMLGFYRLVIDWHVFTGKLPLTIKKPDLPCSCGNFIYKKYWYDTPEKTILVLACKKCWLARTWPIPLSQNLLIDYYKERKDHEDRLLRVDDWRVFCKKTISLIKKYKKFGRLLDVGCNLGIFVDEAKKQGFSACGIDLSNEAIEVGKIKLGLDGLLSQGSLYDKKYPKDSWDIIAYIHCLEHVEFIDKELEEVREVIKPDGFLVIEVPRFFSFWRLILGSSWYGFSPFQHIWQFGKRGLVNCLKRNGFKIIKSYTRVSMYHKIDFSIKGFITSCFHLLAYLTGTGDNLIVIAQKK